MRALVNRLHRLENAVAPAERERAAAEAILEARRRRLGSDYEPVSFPPERFAGCRVSASAKILIVPDEKSPTPDKG
jgi:hypothetical protein